MPADSECPVCFTTLPQSTDGSKLAAEAHVNQCIESQLTASVADSHLAPPAPKQPMKMPPQDREDDECPICHTSLLSKQFDGNDGAKEAHVAACIEEQSSASTSKPSNLPPSYSYGADVKSNRTSQKLEEPAPSGSNALTPLQAARGPEKGGSMQQQDDRKLPGPVFLFSNQSANVSVR